MFPFKFIKFRIIFGAIIAFLTVVTAENVRDDVAVLTVATNLTDGYNRFLRSAQVYNVPVKTLGLGTRWNGGSMKSTGGGQKINLLKNEIVKYATDPNKIVLFTDSYDVIFLAGLDEIVGRFLEFDARVVFAAEPFCWPDKSLASSYPHNSRGKQYLNSGGIIAYAPEFYTILTHKDIGDDDDDQLFYTHAYLNESMRNSLKIKLDHKSEIFHNLNGAVDEIVIRMRNHEAFIENTAMKTTPLILHGNGQTSTKIELNSFGNYLARSWSSGEGCLSCKENVFSLADVERSKFPKVFLAIFVSKPTPFIEDFFRKIGDLSYPKDRLSLFIYNNVRYHEGVVEKFVSKFGLKYRNVKQIGPSDEIVESHAKTLAVEQYLNSKTDYYFNVDSEAHLDNSHTLTLLIEQNRSVIAPMLVRPYKSWSNFWGALSEDGFYSRSFDYMEIVNSEKRGLWNVPYISSCYLINSTIMRNPETRPIFVHGSYEQDMAFCYHMREKGVFMYVSNRVDFGHLINPQNFDIQRTHPDFYQIFDNKWDWEQREGGAWRELADYFERVIRGRELSGRYWHLSPHTKYSENPWSGKRDQSLLRGRMPSSYSGGYLHENYSENLNPTNKPLQPCPDVYWFPVTSPRFCRELIEIMETYGKWSDGSNKDLRLDGGYENVPTRDIHMKQVGLEPNWLYFLKEFVRPIQEKVFTGYYHDDDRLDGGYEAVPTRDIHMNQVGLEKHWLHFLEKYVAPLNYRVYTGYQDEPPRALMNFVVRYKPDEQPSLRPHHDSSTYTINIALNNPKKDYEGGGCRFIRYNCSVTDTRLGWLLMHPGRLTHYHEGLPVTKGTRYIMISFVDP